jgi:hypothetical protein
MLAVGWWRWSARVNQRSMVNRREAPHLVLPLNSVAWVIDSPHYHSTVDNALSRAIPSCAAPTSSYCPDLLALLLVNSSSTRTPTPQYNRLNSGRIGFNQRLKTRQSIPISTICIEFCMLPILYFVHKLAQRAHSLVDDERTTADVTRTEELGHMWVIETRPHIYVVNEPSRVRVFWYKRVISPPR